MSTLGPTNPIQPQQIHASNSPYPAAAKAIEDKIPQIPGLEQALEELGLLNSGPKVYGLPEAQINPSSSMGQALRAFAIWGRTAPAVEECDHLKTVFSNMVTDLNPSPPFPRWNEIATQLGRLSAFLYGDGIKPVVPCSVIPPITTANLQSLYMDYVNGEGNVFNIPQSPSDDYYLLKEGYNKPGSVNSKTLQESLNDLYGFLQNVGNFFQPLFPDSEQIVVQILNLDTILQDPTLSAQDKCSQVYPLLGDFNLGSSPP